VEAIAFGKGRAAAFPGVLTNAVSVIPVIVEQLNSATRNPMRGTASARDVAFRVERRSVSEEKVGTAHGLLGPATAFATALVSVMEVGSMVGTDGNGSTIKFVSAPNDVPKLFEATTR
jgi:hypothetical protein